MSNRISLTTVCAATLCFAAGGFFALFCRFFGDSVRYVEKNDSACEAVYLPLESDEALALLNRSAERYLAVAAVRLGDRFNAEFYYSVVRRGFERFSLSTAVPSTYTANRDKIDFNAILGPFSGRSDGALDEAALFLSRLDRGVGVPSVQTAGLSAFLPESEWGGNPLNAIQTFSPGELVALPTRSAAWIGALIVPGSFRGGILFSILSLIFSMTRPEGVWTVLAGGAASLAELVERSKAAFRAILHSLILKTRLLRQSAVPAPFDGTIPPDGRMAERSATVLLI